MILPVEYTTASTIRSNVDFWSGMYLMLAWVQFFAFVIRGIVFAVTSERLIHRLRDRAFRAILRQDVAFFDERKNSTGALTALLSVTTTNAAGLSGVILGTLVTLLVTLISASALGLAIGWKLSLVCISTIPILLSSGFLQFWMLARFKQRSRVAYTESTSFASEAISAIRTVASLTREAEILEQYKASLAGQRLASLKSVIKSSILYAGSQCLAFLPLALGFWYGGQLL